MVAASSYQNDGRAAPLRLTVAASTATIGGSSTGGDGLITTPSRTRRHVARCDHRTFRRRDPAGGRCVFFGSTNYAKLRITDLM